MNIINTDLGDIHMENSRLKRLVFLLILPVLVASNCGIIGPDPPGDGNTFIKQIGISEASTAYSVWQTFDGGYIVAGRAYFEETDYDIYLVKTDARGVEKWSHRYGGEYSDVAYSVQQTMDGGFIVTGSIQKDSTNLTNIVLLKIDEGGSEEWSFTFGERFRGKGLSVIQTAGGGYVLTGQIWVDDKGYTWIIKTEGDGTEEWNRMYGVGFNGEPLPQQLAKTERYSQSGGAASMGVDIYRESQTNSNLLGSVCSTGCLGYEAGHSVKQTTDGGYIIAGETQSFGVGFIDVWLIKTDSEGLPEWQSVFGGTVIDIGYSVEQTTDGGYIIAGETSSYGLAHSKDVWLIKTDAQGTEMWSKAYGGKGWDIGHSVQQTSDGGFIIAGVTETEYIVEFDRDVLLIKIDALGNEKWLKTFDGNGYESGYAVQQTEDGGYILAGSIWVASSSHIWLLKTDSEGNVGPEEE